MRKFRRKKFLGLATLGLALTLATAACESSAAPEASNGNAVLKIQAYSGVINLQTLYVAKEKGFWKDEGVDVEFVPLETGPAGLSAMLSGDVDLAMLTPDLVFGAISRGANLQMVCGSNGAYAIPTISNKIADPDDSYPGVMKKLVGKKLGVIARGSNTEFIWRALFEGAGLDADSATYVAIGGYATGLPAFKSGQVDGHILDALLPMVAEEAGFGHRLVDFSKGEGPESMSALGSWHTAVGRTENIKKKADAMAGYARGIEQAVKYMGDAANQEEIAAIVKTYAPMPNVVQVADRDAFYLDLIATNTVISSQHTLDKSGLGAWLKFGEAYEDYDIKDADAAIAAATFSTGCKG